MQGPHRSKVRSLSTLDRIEVAGANFGQFIGKGEAANVSVYMVTTSAAHPFPRTLHKKAEEVIHVLAGRGRVVIDEESFPVTAGSLVFVPPGAVHHIEAEDGELTALAVLSPPVYQGEDLYFV